MLITLIKMKVCQKLFIYIFYLKDNIFIFLKKNIEIKIDLNNFNIF